MAYIVMAFTVMAKGYRDEFDVQHYIVMAYIVMAYIVMAYIGMAKRYGDELDVEHRLDRALPRLRSVAFSAELEARLSRVKPVVG